MKDYQERFYENYSEESVKDVLSKDRECLNKYDVRNLNRYYYHPLGKKMCGWCKEVLEATKQNFAIKRHTKEGFQLNFRCKACDKIYRESWTAKIKSDPIKYCQRLNIQVKNRAKVQNLDYDIDGEYLYDLLIKQEYKCYYTGHILDLNLPCINNNSPDPNFPSVDKLDPRKGYVKGNVVWCLYYINRMKNDLDETTFLETCSNILEYKKEI